MVFETTQVCFLKSGDHMLRTCCLKFVFFPGHKDRLLAHNHHGCNLSRLSAESWRVQAFKKPSQVMNDIPYGDCFRVEARWDIENIEPSDSRLSRCKVEPYTWL